MVKLAGRRELPTNLQADAVAHKKHRGVELPS